MFSPTPRPSTADRGTHRRRPSPVPIACAVAWASRVRCGIRGPVPATHDRTPSTGGAQPRRVRSGLPPRGAAAPTPHATRSRRPPRGSRAGRTTLPAPTLEPRDGAAGVTLRGIERQHVAVLAVGVDRLADLLEGAAERQPALD